MKKILIAYASNVGSTAEIAQSIANDLITENTQVDVRDIREAGDLKAYDAVILGAPMMMGLHPGMLKYIQAHQKILADKPVACFITALRLTDTGETHIQDTAIFKDEQLANPPRDQHRLSFKERRTSIHAYLESIFSIIPNFKPVSISFMGGALNLRKLKWLQFLIVTLLFQFKSTDRRNWNAIHTWSKKLPDLLHTT
ncbi:MAG: hypothetical protein JEZ00_18010 [Anaerolineaceae bacterium]|nr:hypothetical protein [Anaerolineaceae bacterium]